MEMRQRRMQQHFRTPQHPSTQKDHWINQRQQFRTPQHPSVEVNHWSGSQSLHFDFGTPQHEFQGRHEYWDGDLPSEFGTPQHPAASGKNYWGTVDGKRQFGTPLSPAAFGTKHRDIGGETRQSRTPQHPATLGKNYWGTVDGTRQFGTPQHPNAFREFRTPQHPSQGTNNWGGASPLLARNIPQESLDKRYERLNTSRTRDVIFTPVDRDDDFMYSSSRIETKHRHESSPNSTPNPNSSRRRGLLWKLIKREPKDQNPKVLGNPSKKKKKWFPRLQKRWPTGWF